MRALYSVPLDLNAVTPFVKAPRSCAKCKRPRDQPGLRLARENWVDAPCKFSLETGLPRLRRRAGAGHVRRIAWVEAPLAYVDRELTHLAAEGGHIPR
jgi:hypothetical protein